ncbi:MAG TPA: TRAP transporter substrate-binding protein [Alphaproteobacteria bacterium]
MRWFKIFSASLIAVGAMLVGRQADAQQTIELKVSHFLPAVHGIHTDFIEPWARELERRTNNKVKVTVFPGGSSFGDVARQYDQVKAGVIDIAHGLHGIPRGRFPRTSVIDLPFLTENADVATRTLWALYPKYLKEEYPGVKVLALHAHNGGLIHTREKQITQLADLKGLRIRAPSPAVQMMLEYLGATPVGLPPGQVYENLQKGAIDGAVFPWDPVASFKLAEVLKYHLDARTYTVSFFFVMNQRKYDSLPADVKQAIDAISGDALIPKFGPWWNKWDQAGLDQAKARGNVIVRLSDEERNRWRDALTPMTEAYLKSIEDQGVKNVREIYDEARRLVAQFEKKS